VIGFAIAKVINEQQWLSALGFEHAASAPEIHEHSSWVTYGTSNSDIANAVAMAETPVHPITPEANKTRERDLHGERGRSWPMARPVH
jgi:hypothetical protein